MADSEMKGLDLTVDTHTTMDSSKEAEQGTLKIQGITEIDEYTDITFIVEDKPLYANKGVLALTSPVWKAMFGPEYASANKIDLPGKRYDDVLEFLQCITPGVQKRVRNATACVVLPLADEYQVEKLKQECEHCLIQTLQEKTATLDHEMTYLLLAQQFVLDDLRKHAIEKLSKRPIDTLKHHSGYKSIEPQNILSILESHSSDLEAAQERMVGSLIKIKHKITQIDETIHHPSWNDRCDDHSSLNSYMNCKDCMKVIITKTEEHVSYLLNIGQVVEPEILWLEEQ